jgi:hypothetical protein
VADGQKPETSAAGERIGQEVEALALIGFLRDRQRRPGAECPCSSAAPSSLQPFLAIETRNFLWFMASP